jgi:hypothetical protein
MFNICIIGVFVNRKAIIQEKKNPFIILMKRRFRDFKKENTT